MSIRMKLLKFYMAAIFLTGLFGCAGGEADDVETNSDLTASQEARDCREDLKSILMGHSDNPNLCTGSWALRIPEEIRIQQEKQHAMLELCRVEHVEHTIDGRPFSLSTIIDLGSNDGSKGDDYERTYNIELRTVWRCAVEIGGAEYRDEVSISTERWIQQKYRGFHKKRGED